MTRMERILFLFFSKTGFPVLGELITDCNVNTFG
jgi:hypothetical protein